ncbi:MAG: hypothetical protein JO006_07995, partial [Paucibacter sp.]|nr:hypothetical protein [Roseateles sp.]
MIVLSKTSIVNSGTDSLTATVTAIDANRDTVANVPVTFKVDGNAIATAAGSTTGSDGTVRASISEGSDNSTRTVNVTATSGSITRSVSFSVVQAPPASTTPQAADLTLSLDASTVNNSGSVAVNATAIAVDANRNALAGIPVQFAVDSNAVIVPGGTQTDSNGKVPGAVTIGSDHSNRTITVTATSGTLVRTAAFRVVGAALQATAVPTVLTAGAAGNQINYTLVDFNKNPMSNQAITVTGSGLPSASAKTDSNGQYSYVYTAPSTPGALTITASAGGATASTTVTVPSGTTTVPTVTTTVSSATLTLSPNVVQVNTNGTNNIATLSTLFVSASNAPIPNIRVRYDLNGDPLSVGGTIGAGANVIYADASGTAISTYAPGAIASPTNGVTIRACWDYADFAAGTCPNQVTKTLTVVASPISISIGTNNQISTGPSGLTYVKKYVLLVVDPAGNPKPDVQLSVSLDLNGYYKGFYGFDSVQKIWTQQYWSGSAASATDVLGLSAMCGNEDVNRNGVIDAGEDANGNSQLDPRKSDASISLVGSTKTDSNGIAVLQLEYPQSVATWVNFTISANAAGVLSPPALLTSILPAASADLTTQNPPPAFQYSPYGQR